MSSSDSSYSLPRQVTQVYQLQMLVIQLKLINLIITPFYFKLDNFNVLKTIIMGFINLNSITNSCNLYTCVTWRGNEYELPEDDTIVSKRVGV